MIVVTGATGALNGATVDHLLKRVSPQEIAVVTRDLNKAERLADKGLEVRHGDYARPETLPEAFKGADQLLLVSSNDPAGDTVSLHRNAVDAAIQAGVGRILYTSHQGAAADTPFNPGRHHFATEQMLAESGVAWTSLRNGFYAHSLIWLMGAWQETGKVSVPADGPVSWTAREDAAEAAAVILTSGGAYDGPTTLTANAAPTFEEVAAIASEVTGRSIGFEMVDAESWVAGQVAGGQPAHYARFTLGMYQAAEQGFFAGTEPLLGELLGREPQSVRDLLARS
jgi:NAD(P)H dehydrogenase (quinone)